MTWWTLATVALASNMGSADGPAPSQASAAVGWYHIARDEPQRAVAVAMALLEARPDHLEAHRLYGHAYQGVSADSAALVALYRRWRATEDGVAARFGLAQALSLTELDDEGCAELGELLGGLGELEPDAAYAVHRVRRSVAEPCSLDSRALDAELAALAPRSSDAWGYHQVTTARTALTDEHLTAIPRLAEVAPQRLATLASISAGSKGRVARQARKALVEAAVALDRDDPVAVHHALGVLEAADDDRVGAWQERLDTLDPPSQVDDRPELSPLARALYEANRRPTHELALADLDAMAADVPSTGPDRALWQTLRGRRLEALGRADEAYAAARDAARATPEDYQTVNGWAYQAALAGRDLDEALAAMDGAIAHARSQVYTPSRWGTWDDWAESTRWTTAAWLDTQGWLLHKLGRHDEAAAVLTQAVLAVDDPVLHGHLGLAWLGAGDEGRAFAHLARAAAGELQGEPELAEQVRREVVALYPAWGRWHPDGLDGYLASLGDDGGDDPVDDEVQAHPLIGEVLPFEQADRLGGGTLALAEGDGPLVIDLWATWCGPCVAGMPHLQEVAATYADRGVRVVGLSVDKELGPVKRFFRGAGVPAYELGYLGVGGFETMRVDGIPALFVLDADRRIVQFISGYGGEGDDRLERALDEVLGG